MKIISQLDYAHIKFPGTNYRWSDYGCLATCLCMLLDKTVEEFVTENPSGWTADGNLKTDSVLAKYGYKITREAVIEGQPLKQYPYPVIMRTSWFNPRFPTHFFVQQPNSFDIVDPASRYNPKTENRYKLKINEVRYLTPLNTSNLPPKNDLSIEQRVKRIEDKLGII